MWKKQGRRVELDPAGPAADYAIALRLGKQLYGLLRPSPASTRRLAWILHSDVRIYVRNAREATLITEAGTVPLRCITHFDLPESNGQDLWMKIF